MISVQVLAQADWIQYWIWHRCSVCRRHGTGWPGRPTHCAWSL